MKSLIGPLLALVLSPTLGCVVYVRDEQSLLDETVELIDSRREQLEACHGRLLTDSQLALESTERASQGPYADIGPAVDSRRRELSGRVVVRFRIDDETGRFSDARVDDARTTAPAPLCACVIASLEGLVLNPPDRHDGELALVWEFEVGKRSKDRPTGGEPTNS